MRPQIPRGMAAFAVPAVQAVPAVPAVQPVQALAGASAESIEDLAASSRAAQYLLMAASSLSGTAPEGDVLNAPAVAPAAARVTRPPTHPIDLAAAAALYAQVTTTGDPTS
ncbi:hypothetical protein, partial [Microbacterium aurantiacum]|uniref:hypothetical protein n=1 Tax=Microbacterium aurantiacum TaxID=162393 RepID=UPI00403769F8